MAPDVYAIEARPVRELNVESQKEMPGRLAGLGSRQG
jgi:hypothetical protein